MALTLRKAAAADRGLYWHWASDPEVRRNGFHPEAIPWEIHCRWFEGKLRSAACDLLVLEDDGLPIGQVRLDYASDGQAEVDISIAKEFRGQGYGAPALRLAGKWASSRRKAPSIVARIRSENRASLSIFRKAGYQEVSRERIEGFDAVRMLYSTAAVSEPQLRIRCDGGGTIGFGHVMRCLALAQACREMGSFQIRFLTRRGDGSAADCILREGFEVQILADDLDEAGEIQAMSGPDAAGIAPAAVFLDHYGIGERVHRELRARGIRLAAIDDVGGRPFLVDLLLNQNPGSEGIAYATLPETRALLGPRYSLLRSSFLKKAATPRTYPEVARRILVTLGGADSDDRTSLLLSGLRQIREKKLASAEIVVVLGPSYLGAAASQVYDWPADRSKPHVLRAPENMETLMADADLAVTGAGSTCFETAALGLPSIALLLYDNQRLNEEGFRRLGTCISLGEAAKVRPETIAKEITALALDRRARETLGRRGKALVDGQGSRRVAEALLAICSAASSLLLKPS